MKNNQFEPNPELTKLKALLGWLGLWLSWVGLSLG